MLLETTEAAQALDVDEATIVHWIRNEELPAERVRGRYQTHAVDLLEWATERGMKVNPFLYDLQHEESGGAPRLSEALRRGGIHRGVAGGDKESVFRNVVAHLELPRGVDSDFVLQVLLAREALGTTAVGDGIAIPHVRNPILLRLRSPRVSLSFLQDPLEFEAPDGKPVRLLFTILARDVRMHLHLLSRLAFCLHDPRLREILGRDCGDAAILALIREIEEGLPRGSQGL